VIVVYVAEHLLGGELESFFLVAGVLGNGSVPEALELVLAYNLGGRVESDGCNVRGFKEHEGAVEEGVLAEVLGEKEVLFAELENTDEAFEEAEGGGPDEVEVERGENAELHGDDFGEGDAGSG